MSNLLDLVGEWKTRFFFVKLKGSGEIASQWGVMMEWRVKPTDIPEREEIRNPMEVALASLLARALRAKPLGVGESAKVYAKIEEEIAKEQVRVRGRHAVF
ncbi:hypothetical protein ACLOJK_019470 [Asimina triloba]